MVGNGSNCDDVRGCGSNPCFEGVSCFPLGEEEYVCGNCPDGMEGDGRQCKRYVKKFNQLRYYMQTTCYGTVISTTKT